MIASRVYWLCHRGHSHRRARKMDASQLVQRSTISRVELPKGFEMIRTTMEHQASGLYDAQLFDGDLLIAQTTEPLSFSLAMRRLGRASADYVLAQANVARHSEGPI